MLCCEQFHLNEKKHTFRNWLKQQLQINIILCCLVDRRQLSDVVWQNTSEESWTYDPLGLGGVDSEGCCRIRIVFVTISRLEIQ